MKGEEMVGKRRGWMITEEKGKRVRTVVGSGRGRAGAKEVVVRGCHSCNMAPTMQKREQCITNKKGDGNFGLLCLEKMDTGKGE